jgi:hypothetical protein
MVAVLTKQAGSATSGLIWLGIYCGKWTNSMEQSPSWEANMSQATQEIPATCRALVKAGNHFKKRCFLSRYAADRPTQCTQIGRTTAVWDPSTILACLPICHQHSARCRQNTACDVQSKTEQVCIFIDQIAVKMYLKTSFLWWFNFNASLPKTGYTVQWNCITTFLSPSTLSDDFLTMLSEL